MGPVPSLSSVSRPCTPSTRFFVGAASSTTASSTVSARQGSCPPPHHHAPGPAEGWASLARDCSREAAGWSLWVWEKRHNGAQTPPPPAQARTRPLVLLVPLTECVVCLVFSSVCLCRKCVCLHSLLNKSSSEAPSLCQDAGCKPGLAGNSKASVRIRAQGSSAGGDTQAVSWGRARDSDLGSCPASPSPLPPEGSWGPCSLVAHRAGASGCFSVLVFLRDLVFVYWGGLNLSTVVFEVLIVADAGAGKCFGVLESVCGAGGHTWLWRPAVLCRFFQPPPLA